MKVPEYILLIFAAMIWAEPIAARVSQGFPYETLDWPTPADISESLPTGFDKSSRSGCDKSSEEDNCDEDSCGNIYKYTAKKPNGQNVCLKQYVGKVLIIVNYASACGFTYDNVCTLSEFAQKYRKCGLEILVFPSNDFLQNIGGNIAAEELANNHPEFEVFSEICVNGRTQHPMYRFLKNKLPGAFNAKTIKWNFTKFVVDRNGCPVQRYAATDSFKDIEELVQELLKDQCC
ncbi:glutathione peroxidase-like [Metopolophium dirhodum]|uniref:glutathione peroxidase-like n=1 Tax=Metopolophium dirhodum TaxID=44670 RepID=UPI00298F8DC7|nr:glutathione peroxidase-like [Metopolophium dirhodum]